MAVATEQPPPPRIANPDLPPELSDLVMQLLEKDVARRPASAEAVVQALRTLEKKLTRQQEAAEATEALSAAPAQPVRPAGRKTAIRPAAQSPPMAAGARGGGSAAAGRTGRFLGDGADPLSVRPGRLRHRNRRSRFLVPGRQGRRREAKGPQDRAHLQPESAASGREDRRVRTGSDRRRRRTHVQGHDLHHQAGRKSRPQGLVRAQGRGRREAPAGRESRPPGGRVCAVSRRNGPGQRARPED